MLQPLCLPPLLAHIVCHCVLLQVCLFPEFSTLISAAFAVMYILALWAVLGRVARSAINRMLSRRIRLLQVRWGPSAWGGGGVWQHLLLLPRWRLCSCCPNSQVCITLAASSAALLQPGQWHGVSDSCVLRQLPVPPSTRQAPGIQHLSGTVACMTSALASTLWHSKPLLPLLLLLLLLLSLHTGVHHAVLLRLHHPAWGHGGQH
jgi:hypothetical protein